MDFRTAVEGNGEQSVFNEFKHAVAGTQVKSGLGQDGFTGEKRFRHFLGNIDGPPVMAIRTITKRDDKTGIGNALHRPEYPVREDRSAGPAIVPA